MPGGIQLAWLPTPKSSRLCRSRIVEASANASRARTQPTRCLLIEGSTIATVAQIVIAKDVEDLGQGGPGVTIGAVS